MIKSFFGILDLMSWLALVLYQFGIFKELLFVFAFYLILKMFIFLPDLVSVMDGITGIFFLFAFFGFFGVATWIMFLFLMQKSIFSLFIKSV